MKFVSDQRGQFFFPDIIIAIVVFVIALTFFFVASDFVSRQIYLADTEKEINEIAHPLMDSLVYSCGEPANWEAYPVDDINSFGLVTSRSVLDPNKVLRLSSMLASPDYNSMKQKLGLSKYEFELELIDTNGDTVFSSGILKDNYDLKLVYSRLASYDGREVILRGVFSYAR